MRKKPLAEQVVVITDARRRARQPVRDAAGQPRARGRFDAQARARTAWTTLRLHPTLATALALMGLGLPAQLARRAASNGHGGPLRRLTRIG